MKNLKCKNQNAKLSLRAEGEVISKTKGIASLLTQFAMTNRSLFSPSLYLSLFLTFTLSFTLLGCGGGKQSATQTTTVTTGNNSAPVISSVSISSSSVQISTQVSLTCTASDNDGDTLSYSWAVSGGSLSSATGSSTAWTAPSTTGNYTATCTVGDGTTNTSGNVSITVSPASSSNNNPTISSVTTAASSIAVGQTTTITVSASDSDGDVLGYSYSATGGTVSGTTSSATYTAPSSAGSYTVQVSVTDGKGGSATGSVSVTVTSSTTTLIDDDFSTFTGWTYDGASTSGAGFQSDGNYLLASGWGTGASNGNYGPLVYKDLSQNLDLSSGTFTLDSFVIKSPYDTRACFYFELLDSTGVSIIKAGYAIAYCGNSNDYYGASLFITILGTRTEKQYASDLNGKFTLKANAGTFTIYYNDVAMVSNTLTSQKTATRLRLGIKSYYGSESLSNVKLDNLKLTIP